MLNAEDFSHAVYLNLDVVMRNAEVVGDFLVGIALGKFVENFALARGEERFVNSGGLPRQEHSCQQRGYDAALAIRFTPGGKKRDEAQALCAAGGRQRVGDGLGRSAGIPASDGGADNFAPSFRGQDAVKSRLGSLRYVRGQDARAPIGMRVASKNPSRGILHPRRAKE